MSKKKPIDKNAPKKTFADAIIQHATGPVPLGPISEERRRQLAACAKACRDDLDLPLIWQALPVWAEGAVGRYRALVVGLSGKGPPSQQVLDACAHYAIVYSRQLEFENLSISNTEWCALALKYAAEARASALAITKLYFAETGDRKTFAQIIVSNNAQAT